MDVFKVAMDEIENTKGGMTISVIENFLCKATRNYSTTEEKSEASKETIVNYLNIVQEYALKLPAKKFALVHPILRPCEPQYTENLVQINKLINESLRTMDLQNVS
jgi:hypothetical protein